MTIFVVFPQLSPKMQASTSRTSIRAIVIIIVMIIKMGDHLEKLIHMYKEYISITSTSSSNIRATKVTQEAARFSLLSLSFQLKLLHNITISLFFLQKWSQLWLMVWFMMRHLKSQFSPTRMPPPPPSRTQRHSWQCLHFSH